MSRCRILAWAGSAVLHLGGAAALLLGRAAAPPQPEVVMVLEMPAAEPAIAATPTEQQDPSSIGEPAPPQAAADPAPEPPEPTPREPAPLAEAVPPAPAPLEPAPAEPAEPEPVAHEESLPPPPAPPPPRPVVEVPRPRPRPRPQPLARAESQVQPGAPAAEGAVQGAAPAPAALPSAAPAPSPNYVARLFAALERHKRYPPEARGRGAQGVALLRFRMRRDGTVLDFRIERSAGDVALDGAVAAMIRQASPLPPLPEEIAGESLTLTLPVRFSLR